MQSSARHLLLIIGTVLSIFGILTFFFMLDATPVKITGGTLFAAGAIMISRGIRNPGQHKNRKPDIRRKYKSAQQEKCNAADEVH